jgi:hypothetical protein
MGQPRAREWADGLVGYAAFGITADGSTWRTSAFGGT